MVISGFEQFQEVTRRKWSKMGDSNIKKENNIQIKKMDKKNKK